LRLYETVAGQGVTGRERGVRSELVVLLLAVAGCRGPTEHREAPVSSSSARPEAAAAPCAKGPPQGDGEAALFPLSAGGLCIDRHAELSRHGRPGDPPLDAACAVLGIDCDRLKRFGLRRLTSLRYADAAGSPTRATLSVLGFDDAELALAASSERIATALEVGQPVRALDGPDLTLLGDTNVVVVRGERIILAGLANERLAPAELVRETERRLPELTRGLAARLPRDTPPPALSLLPDEGRLPLSVRYEGFDLLGITGVGRGARARYEEPGRRYEVVALVRGDADAADDVMETVRKVEGARRIKQAPYGAVRFRLSDGPEPVDWVFGRRESVVIGVGAPVPAKGPKRSAKPPDRNLLRMKALLDRRPERVTPAGRGGASTR